LNHPESPQTFLRADIFKQAATHERRIALEKLQKTLQGEEKETLQNCLAYREAMREVSHHRTQPQEKRFREALERRDKLASQIVEKGNFESFLSSLQLKESKLLEHASLGQFRGDIERFQKADHAKQIEARDALLSVLDQENAPRALHQILIDKGLSRLTLQVHKKAERLGTKETKTITVLVAAYQDASRAVFQAKQKGNVPISLFTNRKQAAQKLLYHEGAQTIFQKCCPQTFPHLERHGGRTTETISALNSQEVEAALKGRTRDLVTHVLGTPNRFLSKAETLRFGQKGSLMIHVMGPKEGLWHNFETGKGGNIFALLMETQGCSFKEALMTAAQFAGVEIGKCAFSPSHPQKSSSESLKITKESLEQEDTQKTIHHLFKVSKGVHGTIAETYLKNHRRIDCTLPSDLRFLSKGTTFTYKGESKILKHDSLAAFARDTQGTIQSVQLTKLNKNGSRATIQGEKLPKIHYGSPKGAFITVQYAPQSPRVFLAEGLETALSIKMVDVKGTIISVGGIHNLKNYNDEAKEIVLVCDHDKPGSPASKTIADTKQHYEKKGLSVQTLMPKTLGHDFNDVLKEQGVESVKKYAESLFLPRKEYSQNRGHTGIVRE
jgi:hypothetical protein